MKKIIKLKKLFNLAYYNFEINNNQKNKIQAKSLSNHLDNIIQLYIEIY